MEEQLMEKVMQEVMKRVGSGSATEENSPAANNNSSGVSADLAQVTEFIGVSMGDTQGIVIANLDPAIHKLMGFDERFRSIGVIGGRTGAGPQLMAADDAIKATNTEIIKVEMPRDTKGGAGHGNLIIFGAEDVSDAQRAVEVTLEMLPKYFGDVYANDQGYTENQYSARASKCLNYALKTPEGKAFGLILGAPAVVGMLMIDTAVKAADVEVVGYASPAHGTSLTNEVFIWVTGDSGAVRQAVIAGREVGNKLLSAWGEEPKSLTTPYI
ncbi:MAG: propanediol utilization microcompartment protein PduB [Desulfosarcina sp.]|nr:propanediol utilization microcompartment protein PduB [Desulfosarcina sp.]MBC2743990.1 propanediol utilization microcompartment protein PduB [Desulfosarcina sp.]MBC2766900.1 propanediol utilization microcompartment protein PduB [Desulfosarcina sp.]